MCQGRGEVPSPVYNTFVEKEYPEFSDNLLRRDPVSGFVKKYGKEAGHLRRMQNLLSDSGSIKI